MKRLWFVCALGLAACATPSPAPPTTVLWPLPVGTPTATGMAVVAVPPTPIIIASPTPAPTPVVHVVQQGDTLISIAVQYGVSVEALQAANPDLNPQFMSIGMSVVIPLGAAPNPVSLAPPPAAPVVVGAVWCDPLPTGALACFTAVTNPGPEAVENLAVRFVVADAAGLPLTDAVAYAPQGVVLPGEAAPVGVVFPEAPVGGVAFGATVVSAEGVSAPTAAVRLGIPSHVGFSVNGQWQVTGEVVNPGTQPLTTVWVVVSLYDVAGQLVGFQRLPLPFGLAPGEPRPFQVALNALRSPVRHEVVAEGK